jgi:hypothetical protein
MFSVITNIYNKKAEGPTLMELFTTTGKLKKMFDVCITGDMAHIDTKGKFLPHPRHHGCIGILHCCDDPCLWISEVTWQWWDKYPVFDISPKKKITGLNVRGLRGP